MSALFWFSMGVLATVVVSFAAVAWFAWISPDFEILWPEDGP